MTRRRKTSENVEETQLKRKQIIMTDEAAEREMEEEGKSMTGQKLSRNKRTKETEEEQADEKERRRKRQIKYL